MRRAGRGARRRPHRRGRHLRRHRGRLGGARPRASSGRRTPPCCRRSRPSASTASCASGRTASIPTACWPGQVLLAPLDFVHRTQYLHARGTLRHLVDLGVVPIVNENDAVADEEIRFGDNDRLAALVAHLVGAQLLVLLTDTPGPADGRPPARHGGVAHRGGGRDRPPARATGRRARQRGRQWRHGVQAGRGQDRHLVGRADPDRRRRAPRRAGGGAGRRGRSGDGVPGPRGPPLGPQAVDRLRAGLVGQPHRRRRGAGGADRSGGARSWPRAWSG